METFCPFATSFAMARLKRDMAEARCWPMDGLVCRRDRVAGYGRRIEHYVMWVLGGWCGFGFGWGSKGVQVLDTALQKFEVR